MSIPPPAPGPATTPPNETVPEPEVHARSRLLQAAIQIFDRKGYATASVREIADAAGVTKPVVYYHFGSKEGLLVAILDQAVRDVTTTLARAVARTGSARERLIRLCEDVYGLFEKNVSVARVAHQVFLGPREQAPPFDVTVVDGRLREAVVRIVEDGQRSAELRSAAPDDVALAVLGILEGWTDRQMLPELGQGDADGLRRILTLFFDGLVTERRAQGELTT